MYQKVGVIISFHKTTSPLTNTTTGIGIYKKVQIENYFQDSSPDFDY